MCVVPLPEIRSSISGLGSPSCFRVFILVQYRPISFLCASSDLQRSISEVQQ